MAYDRNNVFARILRGEVPCKKVYEDEHVLAFDDITARAPTHVLVIPKGEYVSLDDFSANASTAEIGALIRALGHIARARGNATERLINSRRRRGRDAYFRKSWLAGRKNRDFPKRAPRRLRSAGGL